MKKSSQKSKPITLKQILASAEKELKVIYQQALEKSSVLLQKVGKHLEKAGETLAKKEKSVATSKKAKPAQKKPAKSKSTAKPKVVAKSAKKSTKKAPQEIQPATTNTATEQNLEPTVVSESDNQKFKP